MRGIDVPEWMAFNATLREQRISVMDLPTSYWQQWLSELPTELPALRLVTVGGEALPAPALDLWKRGTLAAIRLDNSYGPTESTIAALFHQTTDDDARGVTVPIGAPYPGRSAYVLDASGHEAAIGALGELCIGGESLAQGYERRAGLTAERFVPDPHRLGRRLYRTGDVCRRREDGAIEFLGRRDAQIKLRGHRIELAEVERALALVPRVRAAAVVVRGGPERPRLVAYVAGDIGEAEVITSLQRLLPSYMLPSSVQVLSALPLKPSGKVDLDALPELDLEGPRTQVAPRTELERRLLTVWGSVLGAANLGVTDNFFASGGDSISSLLVASRVRSLGLSVTPKQIFDNPTVAELALVSRQRPCTPSRELHESLALTPAQASFFEQHSEGEPHYNQFVLLRVDGELSLAALRQAVAALLGQHDALRLRFRREAGAWRQRVVAFAESEEPGAVVEIDLRAETDWRPRLRLEGDRLQRSLNLASGPVLRIAHFHLPAGEGRLLVVVHHLAVDGVSWRILLEQLETAYSQAARGERISLPLIGTPWSVWARAVEWYAARVEVKQELSRWQSALRGAPLLPAESSSVVGAVEEQLVRFDAGWTQRLLELSPQWRIDEVLLTAIVQSFAADAGVLVDIEGHGREALGGDELDLSRTLGWFTTQFPVWIETTEDALGALELTRQQLRAVPAKGFHFGLLRHGRDAAIRDAMRGLPRAQVCFNYLGRFDGALTKTGPFSLAREDVGRAVADTSPVTHALDVNALIATDELSVRLRVDPARISRVALSELAARFEARLRALVGQGARGTARSRSEDFPLARLNHSELETLELGSDVEDVYPATPLQQGLLFHTLLGRTDGAYVNQLAVTIRGHLRVDAFVTAWTSVLARHAILRTGFEWRHGGEALQIVHRDARLPISIVDASSAEDYSARWQALRAEDRGRGFELQQAPLMRITLVRRPDGAHDFLWTSHHALLDGWSTSRLLGEVLEIYRFGESRALVAPPYRDYIAWLTARPSAESWWRKQLSVVEEPAGWRESVGAGGDGASAGVYEQRLDTSLTEQLLNRAQRWQVTLPSIVQAAWALVLSRYANRPQVVFGVTVSGRSAELPGVEQMLGLFINSLPVWVEVRNEASVLELVRSIARYMTELGPHEQTPLHELQGWAGGSGEALFDSLLVFENYPVHEALADAESELRFEAAEMVDKTHYPLTLTIKSGAGLQIDWAWRGTEVDRASIERIGAHLASVLEQMADDDRRSVGDVQLVVIPPRVPHLKTYRFSPLTARFAEQVARHSEKCAVQCGPERLSYAELDAWSGSIARRLRCAGVTADARVGVCVARSVALPAALLGVLKAGAAYVPLDPSYPSSRLAAMLDDAGVRCLVVDAEGASQLGDCTQNREILVVESSTEEEDNRPDVSLPSVQPGSLAYVLYTSGSTGRPKGVAVSHEALDRFLLSAGLKLGLRTEDVWLSVSSPSFDIFALELYLPLVTGARVELGLRAHVTDARALAELIETSGASFMQATPVTWRGLVDSGWRTGRGLTALSGGEALAPDLAAVLLECGVALWNMYGPTETTIWSSAARLSPGDPITLGEPFHDCPVRIIDANGAASPTNGLGEICIGGTNLARGYLGQPALTAERFVPDPWGAPGARIYRTGDAGRFRIDGRLEFGGRLDRQVKLRGHRIELGEIEVALRDCAGVQDAAVVIKSGGGGRLVGYVTGDGDPVSIRGALASRLPSFMIPAAIIVLRALPMTLNKKLDRRALLELEEAIPHEAPRTATETALAQLWGEVLGRDGIAVHDDFFVLGGHSLSAVRLIARVRQSFGLDLPLHAVFSKSVLSDQAAELDRLAPSRSATIVRRSSSGGDAPLSIEQERLWFLWKVDPSSSAYGISGALRLEGQLDVPALHAALAAIVTRHEILRTRFVDRAGVPRQLVSDVPAFAWRLFEPIENVNEQIDERLGAASAEPFDLEHGPLLRAELMQSGPNQHVLFLAVHHIVSDGASIDILLRELDAEYDAARGIAAARTEQLPIQYADYALWERGLTNEPELSTKLGRWRELLGTEHPVLDLPVDRARSGERDGRGGRIVRSLGGARVAALDRLSTRCNATRFAILLAAFDVLLYRYSGQRDLRVGVPVSGRRYVETEGLIGLFVNTVVLRLELSATTSFAALLQSAREAWVECEVNQVPFARLVEALQPPRRIGQTPIFRVTFNFEEAADSNPRLGDLGVSPVALREVTVPFDLMLDVVSERGAIELSLSYARDLFDAGTIERLTDELLTILDVVVDDPGVLLSAIPLAVRNDQPALLSYPFRSILQRFSEQVSLQPDAVALSFDGQSCTYQELDAWSNRVAQRLHRCGVRREEPIGICAERSPTVVAAILGVLKAGAAYVPLDPLYPVLRLRETLQDAKASRVIADRRAKDELHDAWLGFDVIVAAELSDESSAPWEHAVFPAQLAYVIYTSGSTGKPKGVGVTHANLARLFDATNASYGFGPSDTWTLFHSPAFDFSVWEIFGALAYGGRLVIVPHAVTRDPTAFRRLLAAEGVTVLNQTPSAFAPLVSADQKSERPLSALRAVIFGGEKLEPALLEPWVARYGTDRPMLVNMYGITETTVHVTHRVLTRADIAQRGARSVIGAAIADLALHVCDESMNTVPMGGVGEIYVSGAGIARGYLGRPGLTASRFLPDPNLPGERLYASGDRARRVPGGDFEYLGRSDSQLKIRGHRVELGEIEATLRAHGAVREAVAVVREGERSAAAVVAYFVAADAVPRASELRAHLAARIPAHMIPSAFVALQSLPLTHNGKLDRSLLPEPPNDDETELVSPQTKAEEVVLAVYAEVLDKTGIGRDADFFLLGGHSLLAVRLAARLSEQLGRTVEVAAVFHHPTVAALAPLHRGTSAAD